MDYVKLGRTGLEVSRLCLGCMSFGEPERGSHAWTLPETESRPLIRMALDLGINFFDTANMYSDGSSEEIVGRALKDFARREEIVIATKVYHRVRPGPNGAGLSRKAILSEVDASLRRLGTDYIDLYQIHRFDHATPLEETLEALNDVVRAGKVRYLGASSMAAWQFMKALGISERKGWARFVSMQNYVNLLYREEEREMLPLCRAEGVWDEVTARSETDEVARRLYGVTAEADRKVVEAVAEIAAARGLPRAQVALAWVLRTPGITAPIVGATRPGHLEDAVAALSVTLSQEEVAALEAPYVPHPVLGYS